MLILHYGCVTIATFCIKYYCACSIVLARLPRHRAQNNIWITTVIPDRVVYPQLHELLACYISSLVRGLLTHLLCTLGYPARSNLILGLPTLTLPSNQILKLTYSLLHAFLAPKNSIRTSNSTYSCCF